MRFAPAVLAAGCLLLAGCHGPRTYALSGQVLAVDAVRGEMTIRHGAIAGYMSAMTMPFKVKDPALLGGTIAPGDLISGTLTVSDTESYVGSLVRTGHAPVPESAPVVVESNVLQPGKAAPDASFVDESGTPRHLSDWRGSAIALTFIYTRCPLPDFCPRMNRHFAAIQDAVRSDPQLRLHARLLSVSLDPDYDTPAVLAAHARRAGADPGVWTFLSGARDAVDRFAVPFGVYVVRDSRTPGVVTHNLRTAVIGADGRLITIFSGGDWAPADLLAALRRGV